METQNENNGQDQPIKEVGSNLTGTAVPAKPGHQRDIPINEYNDDVDDQKENGSGPTENTDALIGNVDSGDENASRSQQRSNVDGEGSHRTEKGDQL